MIPKLLRELIVFIVALLALASTAEAASREIVVGVQSTAAVDIAISLRLVSIANRLVVASREAGSGVIRAGTDRIRFDVDNVDDGKLLLVEASGWWAAPLEISSRGSREIVLEPGGVVTFSLTRSLPVETVSDQEFLAAAIPDSERMRLPEEQTLLSLVCTPTPRDQQATFDWTCAAPATRLDLRMAVGILEAIYHRGVDVVPGGVTSLAPVRGNTGAHIFGSTNASQVLLRPRSLRLSAHPAPHDPLLEIEALPQADAFFELLGVAPGEYEVVFNRHDLDAATVAITVRERGERIDLGEIALQELASISIQLEPPIDGFGQPWTAELLSIGGGQEEGEYDLIADLSGTLTKTGVRSGSYVLIIYDSHDSRWHSEHLQVAGDFVDQVELPVVAVEGVVRKGDEPQEIDFVFGSTQSPVSVRFSSDSSGHFSGYLPHDGMWDIERLEQNNGCSSCGGTSIIALDPVLVEVDSGGQAFVEVLIPDTRLAGRVVRGSTGTDTSVAEARIVVIRVSDETKRREAILLSDEDGAFELLGLEPGHLLVQASAPDGKEVSKWTSVDVAEDEPQSEISLQLREERRLLIHVQSSRGPIPGAVVVALPEADGARFAGFAATEFTNGEGVASIGVSPDSEELEVLVAAPGYGARVLDVELASHSYSRAVFLSEQSGELSLLGRGESRSPWSENLWLFQDGAPMNLWIMLRSMRDYVDSTTEGLVIRSLAAGEYALCRSVRVDSSCSQGVLVPYSDLALEVPDE